MLSSESANSFRAGFVALVGRPNVGKSTLMNALVGQKVSIVSNKPQTTRRRVLGILTTDDYQIVFVDTPGVHKAHTRLGQILNDVAQHSIVETGAVCVVVDSHAAPNDEDKAIAQMLKDGGWIDRETGKAKSSVILCMNKMDLLKPIDVVDRVEAYTKLFGTEQYMLTSLRRGDNLDKILAMMVGLLPESELLYPEDEVTDQPMRILAAELVREKALVLTRQEVPHALATVVDAWEEDGPMTRITISLVVEKQGQKAILIGKQGSMLRRIGTEARKEIEENLGHQVYLELFVKVREDWRQNPRMLAELEITEG